MRADRKSPSASRSLAAGANLFVLVLGILLTGGFYAALERYCPADSLLVRYTAGHPVEYAETWMFFWALAALAAKMCGLFGQRLALRRVVLPVWEGKPGPTSAATELLQEIDRQPGRWQRSLVGQRLRGGLAFVAQRGSTEGLDDHLRSQADADADALDGSYSLLRFITWAIPILGFLGTVLGITDAIANVTPEQLAKSITGVTDGLAIAFDTTAIALGYSMAIMFFSFALDRAEQGVLKVIDARADEQLAHRFERLGHESSEFIAVVRQNTGVLVEAAEELVEKQSQVWARSLEEMHSRAAQSSREQEDRLALALRNLIEQSVQSHQQRLSVHEQKTIERIDEVCKHFERLNESLRETMTVLEAQGQRAEKQAALLGHLLDGEQQILRLQKTLGQNLAALGQSGAFEQAVHSLTAAIHLLTARSGPQSVIEARRGQAA